MARRYKYIGNIIRASRIRGIIVYYREILVNIYISFSLTTSGSTLLDAVSRISLIIRTRGALTFSLIYSLSLSRFNSSTSNSRGRRRSHGASIHSYSNDEGSLFSIYE